MSNAYDPKKIESKWMPQWEKERVYATPELNEGDEKAYTLVMFPYPSGAGLHTGHSRVYTGTDVLARYFRMTGKKVLHPMGWDAFGLPAENSAIKLKKNPQEIVVQNVANFKRQMNLHGFSYDWDREINTTDSAYYAVTQWLFIQFFKRGLLYKKDTPVYYCPVCKTGLAQEEVMGDGTHERCGSKVAKKNLPQWIFRITTYAESLLESLDGLDWPAGILEMQRNWIGKKQGINIRYKVEGLDEVITCFTTRPDTNFGATFVAIAPEHVFAQKLVQGKYEATPAVKEYVEASLRKTERERLAEEKTKTGVFTGYYVKNSLNDEQLPVWISDFVLAEYGTGAVVGVPGHDLRDFEFAQAMDIPVKRVVVGLDGDSSEITRVEQVQEVGGTMVHSGFLTGMDIHGATPAIMDHMEKEGMGERVISYHLRDWIFSRQRYWGEPIPMVFCQSCSDRKIAYWDYSQAPEEKFTQLVTDVKSNMYGWFPLPETALPLELPYVESYEPLESGASPLAEIESWTKTTCPHCGGEATRETDTMPNWAGSCWYFLQFALSAEERSSESWAEALQKDGSNWLPVDWYVGGAEHAVLHLLYARFWVHVFNDMGLVNFREPFLRLRNVGMVQAEDGKKMSKSLGNVVNPDDVIEEFGADALRTYVMFMAPFNQEIAWSTKTLRGVSRFLARVWRMYDDSAKITKVGSINGDMLVSELQTLIQKNTSNIANVKFNTPIASCMEFLNLWEKSELGLSMEHAKQYLQLLAPFAPFMTEELWRTVCGEETSIHLSKWPTVDTSLKQVTNIQLPVQVDGKMRDLIELFPDEIENEAYVTEKALSSQKVKKWLAEKEYRVIYIKGKIVNIVLI